MAALAVSGLAKRYGAVEALGGVDLEVREGELVGLLGPNGAGKSTLVKIACGLVRPTTGSAEVCGARAGSREARAALGYLAELFRFPGWMTADELLELHQRLAGSHGGERERLELLELVGLHDARRRPVEAMSKGLQQRLGIAQALVGSPRLLVLDEPTSALDPVGRPAGVRARDSYLDGRRLRTARSATPHGVRRRLLPDDCTPRPVLARGALCVPPRRKRGATRGCRCADVRRRVPLRHGDVRDALSRRRPGHLPHAW